MKTRIKLTKEETFKVYKLGTQKAVKWAQKRIRKDLDCKDIKVSKARLYRSLNYIDVIHSAPKKDPGFRSPETVKHFGKDFSLAQEFPAAEISKDQIEEIRANWKAEGFKMITMNFEDLKTVGIYVHQN